MGHANFATIKHYDYNLSMRADAIQMSKEEIIDYRKSRRKYPPYHANDCAICHKRLGSKGSKKCCSHSLPQFVLRYLGQKPFDINAFIKIPYEKKYSGIQAAGVFKLICEHCDNTYFQDYEDETLYASLQNSKSIPQKALNEIAAKNYLCSLYEHLSSRKRRCLQLKDFKEVCRRNVTQIDECLREIQILSAEINDDKSSLEKTLILTRNLNDRNISAYQILYHYVFDRSFPIALQGKVTIDTDCWGNRINNLFDYEAATQDMHICFFPSDNKTTVLVFTCKDNNHFAGMIGAIRSLSNDQIAKAFLAMFMAQNSNFFLSESTNKEIFDNPYLRQLAGDNGTIQSFVESTSPVPEELILKNIKENNISFTAPLLAQYEDIPDSLIGL